MVNKKHIQKDAFHKLLDSAFGENKAESKQAVKNITALRYEISTYNADQILKQIPARINTKDSDKLYSLIRLVNIAVISKHSRQYYDQIIKLFYKGIVHESGKNREIARRLIDNFTFFSPHSLLSKEAYKQWDLLISDLEDLIKSYQPENVPSTIENHKPCVYKTLILTWYDMVYKMRHQERRDIAGAIIKLDIPAQYNEVMEETYDDKDWDMQISNHYIFSEDAKTKRLLNELEIRAEAYLAWSLDQLKLSDYLQDVRDASKKTNSVPHIATLIKTMLPELSPNITQEDYDNDIKKLNKLARSIQYYDNNLVRTDPDGNNYNKLMIESALQESYRSKPKNIDQYELILAIVEAKRGIDNFFKKVKKDQIKFNNEMKRKFGKSYDDFRFGSDFNFTQSIHSLNYMLDWIVQSDYRYFLSKTPQQLTASLVCLGKDIPISMEFAMNTPENQELAEYGGWKSSSSLTSQKYHINSLLLSNMQDPSIIFTGEQ